MTHLCPTSSGWLAPPLHTAKYAIVPLFQILLGTTQGTLSPILFIGVMAHNNRQLAIFSIIYYLFWLFSLGSMGFSSAITVRVGNFLSANDPKRSRRSAVTGVILAQMCLRSCSIILLFVSEPLSHLFTTDPSFAEELQWNIRIFSFFIICNFSKLLI